jgi:5-deoxy-glucuronate isomerase
VLGGQCSVRSSAGDFMTFGGRRNVFDGVAYTLTCPSRPRFTVTAETDCDLALCYCRAEGKTSRAPDHSREVPIEIRGGGNATRQINHLLMPAFPAPPHPAGWRCYYAGRQLSAILLTNTTCTTLPAK